MAEIEIGVLSRQALAKPIAKIADFKAQVNAWTTQRNNESSIINWQFTTADLRMIFETLPQIVGQWYRTCQNQINQLRCKAIITEKM